MEDNKKPDNKKPESFVMESSESSIASDNNSTISSTSTKIPSSSTPLPSSSDSLSDIEEEQLKVSSKELENEFKVLNCKDENLYSNDCNKFLLKRELLERNYLKDNKDVDASLYPNLNDTDFNVKIASKKEFNDTKYELKTQALIIIKLSDKTALNPTSFA